MKEEHLHHIIADLYRHIAAQSAYIVELEKQLEPSVIEEIKAELEARELRPPY